MSVAVELAELAERIEGFGPVAYLVTINPDHTPHIVSVAPTWNDSTLALDVGSRSRSNVEECRDVSLLWPAPPAGDYSLIVDGKGTVEDGAAANLRIEPSTAVLHRIPEASETLPGCVRLFARP